VGAKKHSIVILCRPPSLGRPLICSLCGRRERNVRRTPEPSGRVVSMKLLCCLRATLILNRPAHIDSGLVIGPEFGWGLASVCEWGVMSATMITPVECRQHAVECQRMAERAANLRMQSILIDMARTWRRLGLEVEQQSSYKNPTPDGGVAGAADRGGVPVGHGADLFGARQ
jgi:hypothetical protein